MCPGSSHAWTQPIKPIPASGCAPRPPPFHRAAPPAKGRCEAMGALPSVGEWGLVGKGGPGTAEPGPCLDFPTAWPGPQCSHCSGSQALFPAGNVIQDPLSTTPAPREIHPCTSPRNWLRGWAGPARLQPTGVCHDLSNDFNQRFLIKIPFLGDSPVKRAAHSKQGSLSAFLSSCSNRSSFTCFHIYREFSQLWHKGKKLLK